MKKKKMFLWKKLLLKKVNNNIMRTTFVVVYLLVLSILIILPSTIIADDWSASCSANCTCKWTNGKKSAICNSLQLTTIPTTLSTELQVLVLNDNYITYLNREEFITLGLLNLQRIYLKKSNIQYINKETFKNLKILVEIDLSDNKIELIDKDTFMGNDRLRLLYLNGNPLKKLIAYQFPILPHLRTLDLHNCLLNYIDPLAFANLNLLEFLYLKNNLLENLSEYVFQHMINLKTLTLDDNPWQCNCKLRNFRNWYIKSKLNSISLICKGPFQHKLKNWENIDEMQFGCIPKVDIFSNDDLQNIDIGTNTTFSCLIYGDPLPDIIWELNGKNFDNDNILFDQEIITSDKLWSNLTVFNMSSLDAGTYSCSAQNIVGISSQNISIYLSEIVQHVLVKTPETFWYFGLIMGTFGTVFLLIIFSFIICLCKRQTRRRHHPNKNIKGSVSFNDQEKKLLDLSITTTNDRGDSCGIDNNHSTSINKTESVIGFEPIEINADNRNNNNNNSNNNNVNNSGIGIINGPVINSCMVNVSGSNSIITGVNKSVICSNSSGGGNGPNSMVLMATNQQGPSCSNNNNTNNNIILTNNSTPEEFPLNVGVFPPPPEFCSNIVSNPAYGNIFISVSVTQDMLDSSDINIYPDLLNIPKRLDTNNCNINNCNTTTQTSTQIVPSVNVSSFATLPRNHQRRGILKKDPNLNNTNLYPHDEIVSYHNLDTSYCQPHHHIHHGQQQLQLQHLHQQHQQQHQQQQQQQQQHQTRTTTSANKSNGTQCINCMKSQPLSQHQSYVKDETTTTTSTTTTTTTTTTTVINTPSMSSQQSQTTTLPQICNNNNNSGGVTTLSRQSSLQTGTAATISSPPLSACLNYDNMGRRITASGNSTLSLPDEEQMENERLFNESNLLRLFGKNPIQQQNNKQLPSSVQQQQQQQQQSLTTTSSTTPNTTTQTTQSDCLQSINDFVSL